MKMCMIKHSEILMKIINIPRAKMEMAIGKIINQVETFSEIEQTKEYFHKNYLFIMITITSNYLKTLIFHFQ